MTSSYPMYADAARLEISQRLREADDHRRRRLARHGASTRSRARGRRLPWR